MTSHLARNCQRRQLPLISCRWLHVGVTRWKHHGISVHTRNTGCLVWKWPTRRCVLKCVFLGSELPVIDHRPFFTMERGGSLLCFSISPTYFEKNCVRAVFVDLVRPKRAANSAQCDLRPSRQQFCFGMFVCSTIVIRQGVGGSLHFWVRHKESCWRRWAVVFSVQIQLVHT